MISYPSDDDIRKASQRHGLRTDVLIRDLVRIVEVLNLKAQNHFGERSVLAGSMALRCHGSPRFTIYDADFSIGNASDQDPSKINRLLEYADDDLEIKPEGRSPYDRSGRSGWKFEPVRYDPVFTELAGDPRERKFKADFSFRGLVHSGEEADLKLPYDLGIWERPPTIWIMEPHEIVAEKILGWCAYRLFKHYACSYASASRDARTLVSSSTTSP